MRLSLLDPAEDSLTTSTKAYSELLWTLYAAPLDEARWRIFLTQLCELTHSTVGFFLRSDTTLGSRTLASGGAPIPAVADQTFPGSADQTYRAAHGIDPFREALLRNPRTGVIEGEDLVPHEEWVKTDAYRAIAGACGIQHMTCIVVSISPRAHELISLWRGAGRPLMEPDCKDLLALLVPHMQNALRIRRALGRAESRARDAEAMLDTSSTASILLDAGGRILHMNEAAQELALAGDGIRVHGGRILPEDPAKRMEFNALIAAAASAKTGDPGGAIALSRASRKRPLQLLVGPLPLADGDRSAVRVLVLATDPERTVSFPDAMLRELHGLTGAETELANGLLRGRSLEEIAALRGVSVATVRSQMKPLFGKTDTRRQGDLIRLLSTLPSAEMARV